MEIPGREAGNYISVIGFYFYQPQLIN